MEKKREREKGSEPLLATKIFDVREREGEREKIERDIESDQGRERKEG